MRGHDLLIAMRRRGVRPPFVRFELDAQPAWVRDSADWPEWSIAAMVDVAPDDAIARLDLRCAVGMPAVVTGGSDERAAQLFAALLAAGATRVIALTDARSVDSLETPTWPA